MFHSEFGLPVKPNCLVFDAGKLAPSNYHCCATFLKWSKGNFKNNIQILAMFKALFLPTFG